MVCEWRTPATISAPVGLDLHAPAASVALLPPPKLGVNGRNPHRDSGGKPGERRYQAFAVRFAGGFKAKHGWKKFYRNKPMGGAGFPAARRPGRAAAREVGD